MPVHRTSVNEVNEEQKDEGGLAYKDMSNCYYYLATILYFGATVAGSCFIPSVDEIFEFVGVICVNCLGFIFPAVFYLVAASRYRKLYPHSKRRTCLEAAAWIQLIFGILVVGFGMFNNIYGLIHPHKGEHKE